MPNNRDMQGLVNGAGMTPDDLDKLIKSRQGMAPPPSNGLDGTNPDQMDAAYKKIDEILAKQPPLSNKNQQKYDTETQVQNMDPKDFENLDQIPVLDQAKLNALKKLRYGQ